jgi:hypothetical protein
MAGLQIYASRERRLVAAADALSRPLAWFRRRRPAATAVKRVLLLRLERIGDLLMTLDVDRCARAAWPDATIDLAGSWNRDLALDSRHRHPARSTCRGWRERRTGDRWSTLVSRRARCKGRYDVVVNFEPDIRSNFLAWLTVRRSVRFLTGGGGSFLTEALEFDPASHVSENSLWLIRTAADRPSISVGSRAPPSRLAVPADARTRRTAMLANRGGRGSACT